MKAADIYHVAILSLVAAALIALIPCPSYAANRYWVSGDGWWNESTNWNALALGIWSTPLAGDDIHLTQSDSIDRGVYYYNLSSGSVFNSLSIDSSGTGRMTFNQGYSGNAHDFRALNETVGYTGTGVYKQSAGTNYVNGSSSSLYLGYNSGSIGIYELSGTAKLCSYNEYVGFSGSGTFTQTDSTNHNFSKLYLGYNSGSAGTYNLSGGNLGDGWYNEYIGYSGDGTFNQSGGNNNANSLVLGYNAASKGNYVQSAGNLTASGVIGSYGTGTFTQTGGTYTATSLVLAANRGSAGTYNLSNSATLVVSQDEFIGNSGTGSFSQTGGTHNIGRDLYLARNPSGTGAYNLSGTGSLFVARNEYIGYMNGSSFIQTGGSHTVEGDLYLGSQALNQLSTYSLSGTGTLSITNDEHIASSWGSGAFIQTGGSHTVEGDLYVGNNDRSSGSYELSGGYLETANTMVGDYGTGTFTQIGGTHSTGSLFLGSNGNGTYSLSGTGVLTSQYQCIGVAGAGTFSQSGGSNTVKELDVGFGSNIYGSGSGTYAISGGVMSADRVQVGEGGAGTFTQTGGNVLVRDVYVGTDTGGPYYYSGNGMYELSGTGYVKGENLHIGYGIGSVGAFNQSGGTSEISYLALGTYGTGATGTYNLSSGNLMTYATVVGGTSIFTQTDGSHTTSLDPSDVDTNFVWVQSGGSYNLKGGALGTSDIYNQGTINYSGGTITGNLTNFDGAVTTMSGSGTRTIDGAVTNYGTIKVMGAADGTVAVFTGDLINYGLLDTDPARLEFHGDLIIGSDGIIHAALGDQYVLFDDFVSNSTRTAEWNTSGAELIFSGAETHEFTLDGGDVTWLELSLEDGAILQLDGTGSLTFSVLSGLTFNPDRSIANLFASEGSVLYYDPVQNPDLIGTYQLVGGGYLTSVTSVPEPGIFMFLTLGLMALMRIRMRIKKQVTETYL